MMGYVAAIGVLWQDSVLGDWLNGLATDALNAFFGLIETFFTDAEVICTSDEITQASSYIADLSTAIIAIIVVKQVLTTYIFETDGDSDQDPLQLMVRAAEAIALMQCTPVLFNWVLNEAKLIYSKFISIPSGEIWTSVDGVTDSLESVWSTISGAGKSSFALALILMLVGIIAMLIKGAIRGAELALQKVLFPLFCCDLLTASKERFNAFLTSFLVTAFCYSLQLFTFRLCLMKFFSMNYFSDMLIGFGWLYMSLKAPKWIEKYAYTSGIGGLAKTGASSAAQVVVSSIARKAA